MYWKIILNGAEASNPPTANAIVGQQIWSPPQAADGHAMPLTTSQPQ